VFTVNQNGLLNHSTQSINQLNTVLEQNIPNPFNPNTTINYTLPQKYNSANIIITDRTGKALKEFNIIGSSNGSLKVDGNLLSAGAYSYSLFIKGKLIDSTQMIFSKMIYSEYISVHLLQPSSLKNYEPLTH